jgi:phosphoadenosine phosphosulfate reductase
MSLNQPERIAGAKDPAGPIWHDGAFHRDAWVLAVGDEPLSDAATIVSKKRWLAEPTELRARQHTIGLRLEPGEKLDDIADDLGSFGVIALSFPKYSDGRAFSTAALLREKYGYRGELRAVGNVLNDQIPLMLRVGFDSLEVTHAPTRAALEANHLAEVTLYYQPSVRPEAAAGTRPWLRRA